jgi:hypothetical protein
VRSSGDGGCQLTVKGGAGCSREVLGGGGRPERWLEMLVDGDP